MSAIVGALSDLTAQVIAQLALEARHSLSRSVGSAVPP
jgi:hypothetical protein